MGSFPRPFRPTWPGGRSKRGIVLGVRTAPSGDLGVLRSAGSPEVEGLEDGIKYLRSRLGAWEMY